MESVSSCSPAAASTSPTTASGASHSSLSKHLAAAPQRTGAEPLFPANNAGGTLATNHMPHTRDERRDDTVVIQHNQGKTRWIVSETVPSPFIGPHYHDRNPHGIAYFHPQNGKSPEPWMHRQPPNPWSTHGDPLVAARDTSLARRLSSGMIRPSNEYSRLPPPMQYSSHFFPHAAYSTYDPRMRYNAEEQPSIARYSKEPHNHMSYYKSTVVIPQNVSIPKDLAASSEETVSPAEESLGKRSNDTSNRSETPPVMKRPKGDQSRVGFDKLDLLCSATLELGPLQDNPSGCSCPKSKCVALYCDCFKAGRRCDKATCSCLNCKNTIEESGASGARSKAIQAILARNPRAFTNAGNAAATNKFPPGEQACNCIRSRCLKLYCTCFQQQKACTTGVCTCVGCLNEQDSVERARAIEMTLDKRPDAFKQKSKVKILGAGCACKNNQCIRKYCECFRTNLKCTSKCSCKGCKNQETCS